MQLTPQHCLIRQIPDAVSCELAGETVILDMPSGRYFALDPIGTRVWQLLETPLSVEGLCDRLVQEFDVEPDRCREDIANLLNGLAENGLVKVEDVA